jgi:hypothetical protein
MLTGFAATFAVADAAALIPALILPKSEDGRGCWFEEEETGTFVMGGFRSEERLAFVLLEVVVVDCVYSRRS